MPSSSQLSPKVLAITLARGGSKGVPKKNIIDVNGQPLLFYTIREALNSRLISNYIISTDCPEIQSVAESLGASAPFLRPDYLSIDTATSADALKHATLFAENLYQQKFDIVIELMATNPFKTAEHIDCAITKLIETGADSVIGVCKLEDHHPARIKKIVDDKIVDFCVPELSSRRQDLKPDAFIRNGSIYCIQRDLLVNDTYRFGGNNSRPLVMPDICSLNIDTPVDLLCVQSLAPFYL